VKPTVTEEITFPGEENDDRILLGILYKLVESCAHRLRRRALVPRRAGLALRYSDQVEVKRQIHLPHGSFWDFDLYGPLERIFFRACQRRVSVKFMKVWFRDFSPPSAQLSLFPATAPEAEKTNMVTQALDHIRERYGDEAITYGRAV
jgi:DNA polymerase-4